ncbi:hypothetical protein LGH70_20630 [Hymenobacter sp. BT635]|uniref:CBM-cenC domain-containing protein n=1 Tax=Hymenobacter nitidus TaxID=2880929 RepID=A0ABS8AI16_9BACT|nr:hypothetical protein [Hymenobacter nitidus]MCB2380012.1 hypothetical protein [Hymenobacter nitidus]
MRTLTASSLLLLGGLMMASCGGSDKSAEADEKTLINTNFDNFQGWVNNYSGGLSDKAAHSGRYSITVGGGKEYGIAFSSPLGQLIAAKPRKLHLEAWVRIDEPNTPVQLVVQITKPVGDEKVFWKGLALAEGSKPGQWTELKTDLILPENVSSDQILGVYMWANGAGKPVYLDDLRITNAE